ncbi:MAG: hypothetical protein AAB343_00790 [Patescibacteria group bacterium]
MHPLRIHTYFRGENTSAISIEREEIDAFLWLGELREPLKALDPRDRRAVCVFDGTLLEEGISGGSMVIATQNVLDLVVPAGKAIGRGRAHLLRASQDGLLAYQPIQRIALALTTGMHVVQRYDDVSLRKIYTMIRVENRRQGGEEGPFPFVVTWMNSSW